MACASDLVFFPSFVSSELTFALPFLYLLRVLLSINPTLPIQYLPTMFPPTKSFSPFYCLNLLKTPSLSMTHHIHVFSLSFSLITCSKSSSPPSRAPSDGSFLSFTHKLILSIVLLSASFVI